MILRHSLSAHKFDWIKATKQQQQQQQQQTHSNLLKLNNKMKISIITNNNCAIYALSFLLATTSGTSAQIRGLQQRGKRNQGQRKQGRGGNNNPPPPPQGNNPPPPPPPPTLPRFPKQENDLGIRFDKITYVNDSPPSGNNPRPLTEDNFPLTPSEADWLSDTYAVSVIRHQTCGVCDIPTPDLIRAVGGMPRHPSSDPQDPFWTDFLEVVEAQIARVEGQHPITLMPMPNIWTEVNMDIDGVATAVHDEFPGVHHIDLIESFLAEGVTFDRDIIPSTDVIDFIRGPVMLSHINTWTMATVGPHNFGTKWYVGRARPEEVAFAIQTGEIPQEYVPTPVRTALGNLKNAMGVTEFGDATDFTAYPEGSPKHPSWPAMHSAASAGSLWMPVVMNLTPEQLCQARAVDYGVAYARTVAGVHYPTDNTAGLNLGQEILARKLPEYLAEVYGANPDTVAKKIEEMRFDWEDYLNTDCVAGWTGTV